MAVTGTYLQVLLRVACGLCTGMVLYYIVRMLHDRRWKDRFVVGIILLNVSLILSGYQMLDRMVALICEFIGILLFLLGDIFNNNRLTDLTAKTSMIVYILLVNGAENNLLSTERKYSDKACTLFCGNDGPISHAVFYIWKKQKTRTKYMIQKFDFREMDLKGAYLIKPFYATDERGGLIKDYNCSTFKAAGIDYNLKEVFYTISKRGVIRAIHFQLEKPQPKLMRCISGRVWYVIVDLRPESDTFGQYRSMELNGDDLTCVLCPAGFGQGYLVLEDSVMCYKAAEEFYGSGDSGIIYNDPDIGIEWPFELISGKDNMIISEKDMKLMSFEEYKKLSTL